MPRRAKFKDAWEVKGSESVSSLSMSPTSIKDNSEAMRKARCPSVSRLANARTPVSASKLCCVPSSGEVVMTSTLCLSFKIGRASCRERGELGVVGGGMKEKDRRAWKHCD